MNSAGTGPASYIARPPLPVPRRLILLTGTGFHAVAILVASAVNAGFLSRAPNPRMTSTTAVDSVLCVRPNNKKYGCFKRPVNCQ